MFQKKSMRILMLVMVLIFSVTFYFGVFANPNFNIYDFCMNLASEVLGIAITVIFIDTLISRKKKK